MKSGEFEILDNGEVVYKLNDNVRYYLKIIAAAAGSREYGLYRSDNDGDAWIEINPEPLATKGQGSLMIFPSPLQCPQTFCVAICPNGVVTICLILPTPLHTEHFSGEVPGFAPVPPQDEHLSFLLILISFSIPK